MDTGQSILMNNCIFHIFSAETMKVFIEHWTIDLNCRWHWKLFSKNRPCCKSMFLFFLIKKFNSAGIEADTMLFRSHLFPFFGVLIKI